MTGSISINPKFATQVDWNLLRLFVDIVKAGGIGSAARRLNKQQPTISAALKRLEEHAGARLLNRSTSGIELTTAGRALYLICEDMFEAARMAPHQIAQAVKQVEGLARIQVVSSIISAEFNEAIASLHRRHPSIRIEIRVSPWREVLAALDRGEAEVGVGYVSGVLGTLTYEPLSSNSGICKRHFGISRHRAGSMVVFAVGIGRRIMGLRKEVLPMFVTQASSQGLWCNGSYGMDQPTSRQGRLVTPWALSSSI